MNKDVLAKTIYAKSKFMFRDYWSKKEILLI